jgi:hypothetical protein
MNYRQSIQPTLGLARKLLFASFIQVKPQVVKIQS